MTWTTPATCGEVVDELVAVRKALELERVTPQGVFRLRRRPGQLSGCAPASPQDFSLAAAILRERTKVCRIPEGKAALLRVADFLELQVAERLGSGRPATLKTEWVAPGRGETVSQLLSMFNDDPRPTDQTRTSLSFVRPGPPLQFDLVRGREALRRVGVEV